MGRYPQMTAATAYLADVTDYYRPTTLAEIARKIAYLGGVFQSIREADIARRRAAGESPRKASENAMKTDPAKIGEPEIRAFLGWLRERGLDPATQHKYMGLLQGFLDWAGNGVLRRMKSKKLFRIIVPPKVLSALSMDDLDRIRRGAEAIEGWRGDVARFLVGVLPYCGLRPKEIRLARLRDLDLTRWTITVSSPKGEGRWASGGDAGQLAPILPPGRDAVRDYLAARDAYLRANGYDPKGVEPLIPSLGRDGPVPWNESVLIRLKCEMERLSGVRFQIRTLRPTFAQMLKDRGAGIEAVSKGLRHTTTVTTERFYARIKSEKAFAELEKVWLVEPSIPR